MERAAVAERMALFCVGSPARIRQGFQQILDATDADELIIISDAYRFEDRIRSYELVMEAKLDPRIRGDDT